MLNPEQYQLLFQIETNYLISDLFAQHYRTLKCLLILKDGMWKSYIPKNIVEQTLNEGASLFGDVTKFTEFKLAFENYRNSSVEELEQILSKPITTETIRRYLTVISEVWKYYSKTEFFYTDKAAEQLISTGNLDLKENLRQLEQIKNDGRSFMNKLIFTEDCYLDRLLALVSENTGVSKKDLKWYGIEEISGLTHVDQEVVNMRKKFFVMVGDGSSIDYGFSSPEEFTRFFSSETKKDIKGIIANKGVVSGKVKVIPQNYYADFSILRKLFEEMNNGDILVAETTSPELMPACSKAGAIITNQGGLLSHAAIVSRELGVPCIIGTGNATEILKDGMRVEVDADNGVVRIM